MSLIETDKLIKEFQEANAVSFYELNEHSNETYNDLKKLVECAPSVKAIPIEELWQLHKEMSTMLIKTKGERNVLWTCQAMIVELIESYEVNNDKT